MSTMEHVLMSIFDRKEAIKRQMGQQVDSYRQTMACNLAVDGACPPAWLWPAAARNAAAHPDLKEPPPPSPRISCPNSSSPNPHPSPALIAVAKFSKNEVEFDSELSASNEDLKIGANFEDDEEELETVARTASPDDEVGEGDDSQSTKDDRADADEDEVLRSLVLESYFITASHSPEGTTRIALQTHCLTVKMGSCTDVFAGTSLLPMYCRLGFLADARKVFDRMLERISFSWASMFTGYAADKMGDEAFVLFRSMIDEGACHPNEFVFTSVLSAVSVPEFHVMGRQVHCLAVKGGSVSFVSVENSLVTLYAKCEKLGDAVVMFESSGEKNAITWSAMITACAQNGEPGKAVELFS